MAMIKARTVLKILGGIVLGVIVLAAAGWIAFVPSAKEPPYEFVKAWGEKGAGPGQFSDPTGITVADGEVFVADSRNGRIQVFDLDGNFKRMFGKPGDKPGAPGGVAVGTNGELYVADFYGQRVQELKPDGAFIRQWGKTGRSSHAMGHFYYPTDVALDRTGNVYMADGYGNRIQVFASDGSFLRKWGGPLARGIYGPFNGWFTTVTSVVFDEHGNLFAADFYNHRVQKFAADGTFLTSFGDKGTGAGKFDHVIAVAVAEDGTVFIADFLNNRIQKWRPKQ